MRQAGAFPNDDDSHVQRPFELSSLRRSLEAYLVSSSSDGPDGRVAAADCLCAYLPLLSAAVLQQLPAADLLLLLHVFGRLLTEFPSAAKTAPAAERRRGLCLLLGRGALIITKRPLDFLLPSQLPRILGVAATLPPSALPEEFWRCLVRRCAEASRSSSPSEAAWLLLGLSCLPPLPDGVLVLQAARVVCGRLAGAPDTLRHAGSLSHVLEALQRLKLLHAPLLTEIGGTLGSCAFPRLLEKEDKALLIASLGCFAALKATEFQPLFKSLADALVEWVMDLTLSEAAKILSALGALNCYPERLIGALLPHVSSLLAAQLALASNGEADSTGASVAAAAAAKDTLRILRCLGQLQKRDVAVLREVVHLLTLAADQHHLTLKDCAFALYDCYRLDLWHPGLTECLLKRLRAAEGNTLLDNLGLQCATNLLLALSYFRLNERPLFDSLLSQARQTLAPVCCLLLSLFPGVSLPVPKLACSAFLTWHWLCAFLGL
ncbi:uncharacterized protein LOC34621244 [Cyclospora cayetanensis]|uniref:Uncharacterized protein LOC34621244 n=1 Tax=Cyclospora cayetanensis TaxID=88456 RepID=A0A6P6RS39_9EIME|nr:uncharacterized protein LOC34621244 [Cyclospora cayetanensis]